MSGQQGIIARNRSGGALPKSHCRKAPSVAVVARPHGVNANQVFHWRKLLREDRLDVSPNAGQLLPVRLAEAVEDKRACEQSGTIQIELGGIRIRVEGCVDPETLLTVLERLGR